MKSFYEVLDHYGACFALKIEFDGVTNFEKAWEVFENLSIPSAIEAINWLTEMGVLHVADDNFPCGCYGQGTPCGGCVDFVAAFGKKRILKRAWKELKEAYRKES